MELTTQLPRCSYAGCDSLACRDPNYWGRFGEAGNPNVTIPLCLYHAEETRWVQARWRQGDPVLYRITISHNLEHAGIGQGGAAWPVGEQSVTVEPL